MCILANARLLTVEQSSRRRQPDPKTKPASRRAMPGGCAAKNSTATIAEILPASIEEIVELLKPKDRLDAPPALCRACACIQLPLPSRP